MNRQPTATTKADIQDLERVLAVGRLLSSVLTVEEILELQATLAGEEDLGPATDRRQNKQVTPASLDSRLALP